MTSLQSATFLRWALSVLMIAWSTGALAQGETVERTVRGEAGNDIRVGVYLSVLPDCSSGPLPTIRLTNPPSHGKVVVKRGKVRATNYRQCLALEVPGYVAFYKSEPNFSGKDVVILEVKFPNGKTQMQRITVSISEKSRSL
jgi:hypothetical protein